MSRKLLLALASMIAAVASTAVCTQNTPTAASAGSLTSTSQPASGALPEVTIQAQRARLQARVTAYVDKITGPIYSGGIARWRKPVCPLVSGLPAQEGEFILGRISEIARAAGVPLAAEQCHANLYILVSAQPQNLLQAMDARNWWFTFGVDADPNVIHEFIATPRDVRVVYRNIARTPDGRAFPVRWPSHPKVTSTQLGPAVMTGDTYWVSSGLGYSVVWDIFRVFVIIDRKRLQAVSRGQFADYVAMVGLAQLKPSAGLDDAPTILKLFDGVSRAAPAEMSDWDRAFLKSLYSTDAGVTQQRNDIAHAIVDTMVH